MPPGARSAALADRGTYVSILVVVDHAPRGETIVQDAMAYAKFQSLL